jgi:hypothetical protein
MLFWRMDNEPGYALKPSDYTFLYISGIFFIAGAAGSIIPGLLLYKEKKRNLYIILFTDFIILLFTLPPLLFFLLIMLA